MNKKKLVFVAFLAILVAYFYYYDLGKYLTLTSLKSNRDTLGELYNNHRITFIIAFLAIYIVQTALSLPGATILSLAAGAIFGVRMGTVYAVSGATTGATLAFLVTRYLLHDNVERRFGTQLQKLNQELDRQGLNYLLFLRLVPVFPFFLINLAAGLTRLPLRTFFIGTLLGIIPGGFVYCNAGASLATINSPSEIASPRVLGSLALLGIFALIPVFYAKLKGKPG